MAVAGGMRAEALADDEGGHWWATVGQLVVGSEIVFQKGGNGFPRFVTRPPGVSRYPLEELLLQLEHLELCGGGNDPVGPTKALSSGFLAWGRGVLPWGMRSTPGYRGLSRGVGPEKRSEPSRSSQWAEGVPWGNISHPSGSGVVQARHNKLFGK